MKIATVKKGTQVNAKGIRTIKGKKYADLGYGQFVKLAGTKATMWQGSNRPNYTRPNGVTMDGANYWANEK